MREIQGTRRTELVPYADGVRPAGMGVLRGPVWETRALAQQLERQGKIRRLARGTEYVEAGRLLIAVPYEPLRGDVLLSVRRRLLHAAGWVVLGVGVAASLLAMIWEARLVILSALLGAAFLAGSWWLLSRVSHRAGCPGLHCPGCRG